MTSQQPDGAGALPPRWLRLVTSWAWRLLVLVAAGLALLLLITELVVVTLPLVIAIVLATLCVPVRDRLVQRGASPGLAAAIVVFGGIAVIVGVLAMLAPSFVDQLKDLGPTLVDGWDALLTWIDQGPLNIDASQIDDLSKRIGEAFSSGGSGLVSGVLAGAATVGHFLTGLALLVVMLFFIVKDAPVLVDWFANRIPQRHRSTASALGSRTWTALSGYVRGVALIALIDAVAIGIGLWLLGVPLVVPLSLFVFLGGFVPIIGAFIAGLLAVIVALAAGGVITALLVLAVVVGVQQLEGHVLQPVIMKRTVSLHPLVVISALGVGAVLWGIPGAFLSVPVAAVVAAVGNELRLRSDAGLLNAETLASAPSAPLGGPRSVHPEGTEGTKDTSKDTTKGKPRLGTNTDKATKPGKPTGKATGQTSHARQGRSRRTKSSD